MLASGTITLFVAMAIFVVVMVGSRGLLVRRGLTKAAAQTVAGFVGIGVAVGFLLVAG